MPDTNTNHAENSIYSFLKEKKNHQSLAIVVHAYHDHWSLVTKWAILKFHNDTTRTFAVERLATMS